MGSSINGGQNPQAGQRYLNSNTFTNENGTFTSPGQYGPIVRVPDYEARLLAAFGGGGRRRPVTPPVVQPPTPVANTILPGRETAPATTTGTTTPAAPDLGGAFAAILKLLSGG